MKTVAIFGVGLMGGSFGLALRRAGYSGKIAGVSSPATIQAALTGGAIDEGVTFEQGAKADLVYLSQPVSQIIQSLPRLAKHIGRKTLVTDAGSTKRAIVAKAVEVLPSGRFLGGHPMAGKAVRGVSAAAADLFQGRPYFLTPANSEQMDSEAAKNLIMWLQQIGAHVLIVTPEQHDSIVAGASHLPQLVSTALGASLSRHRDAAEIANAAGPGLLDMTRIAMSDYSLWRDILATNRDAVVQALDQFQAELSKVRQDLVAGELEQEFQLAGEFARRARAKTWPN